MESISLRINKIVVDLFGGNVSRFAEKVGTNEANVRNYIKGTTPKYDFILSVYQNIEINFEWFLTGKGEMLNDSNQNAQPVESLNRAEDLRNISDRDLLLDMMEKIDFIYLHTLKDVAKKELEGLKRDIKKTKEGKG